MAQESKKAGVKGLLSIFTGDGKGKTTASLGVLLRAAGHKQKVCMIQFIKGSWKCGEQEAPNLLENVEIHTLGKGFTWKSENLSEDIALAKKGWQFAESIIRNNEHDLVILDELTYLIKYGMVEEKSITDVLKVRSHDMHIIITGRDASDSLMEMADLVTEMRNIKHPYKKGVKAQAGFDF